MRSGRIIICTLLLGTISLQAAQKRSKTNPIECKMNIGHLKNSSGKLTIELTFDKRCEVTMGYTTDQIILTPKRKSDTKKHPSAKIDTVDKNSTTGVESLISLAKSKIGDSYKYGQSGPDHFDCSGFVYYLFKESGSLIPRTSIDQSKSGDKIKREDLSRGDMLFFDTSLKGHVNHSGVYLGDGKFIHSSSGKAYAVTISKLDSGFYLDKFRWGVRKKIGTTPKSKR